MAALYGGKKLGATAKGRTYSQIVSNLIQSVSNYGITKLDEGLCCYGMVLCLFIGSRNSF